MSKTGGGPGTNQYQIKGRGKPNPSAAADTHRRHNALEQIPALPEMQVDLQDILTPAGTNVWGAIDELTSLVPAEKWAVVGGMMVAVHAARHGVEPDRFTNDGDIVVDIRTYGRGAMIDVASSLNALGFKAELSPDNVTRFSRSDDGAKIDLLAPEGLGPAPVHTTPPGRAVQAPGATQSLERTEYLDVVWAEDRSAVVRVPSLTGALVAKAAAATEITSLAATERHKHYSDFAFLLAVAARSPAITTMSASLTKKDRKRLTTVAERIDFTQLEMSADRQREAQTALGWLLNR